MTPTLHTKRLLLEPYVPEDEDDFVALFQDARVSRYMGDGPSPEADDRALFGRIFTKVYAQNLFEVWAVRRDGEYVGHAEIKPTETVGGHEIIYALAPAAWGSGLGTELAEAIVAYGFETLKLTEVFATVAAENVVSSAVLAKLGFRHVRDIEEDDGGTTRVLVR
ncbi:GNAT family N-acetyltransferase [Nonomuraea sp. SMC257]|uniref:GNAT family N-acetyltransferase n=1 Tax=Nonomuraea montanisoli TaxID=2741721 RepID=A0A7Y6M7T0_9ACTN|nr:GNAT family N-acetyltransferase [Nonomuraea montanisoli]NUW36901.1 GNAT family N-acetyltransferase [Nonomuraea montanisoli]